MKILRNLSFFSFLLFFMSCRSTGTNPTDDGNASILAAGGGKLATAPMTEVMSSWDSAIGITKENTSLLNLGKNWKCTGRSTDIPDADQSDHKFQFNQSGDSIVTKDGSMQLTFGSDGQLTSNANGVHHEVKHSAAEGILMALMTIEPSQKVYFVCSPR